MHITLCVDALSPEPGGIGRYVWELCQGLAQYERIEDLRFFAHRRLIPDPSVLLTQAKLPPRRRLRRLAERWKAKRILGSTLVHGPNYFLPDATECGIVTVHDLSVFRFPETHPPARVQAFERQFLRSLERAAHIITDTDFIRRELTDMFGVREESVTAVPLGVSSSFRPGSHGAGRAAVLGRHGLEAGRYALCVSTLEPRKKIAELLRAWRELPRPTRDRFPLVLAGGSGWRNDSLLAEIERAVEEGWLRYLGFVDEDSLPALYSGASLFLYPSAYEGFGLPPVEAMASGVPVIVSDRPCLPEVCGEAARYIDPDDLAGFAMVIEECLSDEEWRARSIERGLTRARQFTWSRCINDTVAVYQQVAGQT